MFTQYLHKLFNYLYWLLFFSISFVIVWGADKSFDLSDEGFTMLMYNPNQEWISRTNPFFYMVGNFFNTFHPDIFFFRILRLILLIFSSFVFSFGFIRWIKHAFNHLPSYSLNFFYPLIGLSTLLSYTFGYQALSYNSLTLFFTQIIFGLFLVGSTKMQRDNLYDRKLLLLQILIGINLCFLFLVKFPSSILSFMIMIVVLSLNSFHYKKNIAFSSLFIFNILLSAAITFFLLYFIGIQPLDYIKSILNSDKTIPGHDIYKLLLYNIDDYYGNFLKFMIVHLYKVYGAALILWLLFRNGFYKMSIAAAFLLLYFMVSYIIDLQYYKAGMTYLYSASGAYRMLGVMILLFTILLIVDKKSREKLGIQSNNFYSLMVAFIILYSLPFTCSLGTNVAISIHVIQFCYSWVALFALFLMLIFKHKTFDFIFKSFLMIILITAASQIVNAFIDNPYRVAPLTEQKHKVKGLIKGDNIKFDIKTASFLESIVSILKKKHQSTKDRPIIVLYNYPGLTYLLGGLSPGAPWYTGPGYENYDEFDCRFFRSSKMNNLKNSLFLIESNYTVSSTFTECLKEKGVDFNNNYILADSVKTPFENGSIYLYIPK